MAELSLSPDDPRILAMAGTFVVAVAFGAALASGAVGLPGVDTQQDPGGSPFSGNVTETPTDGPATDTDTDAPTDGPVTDTDTDTPTEDPVMDPAGGPSTDTDTGTATDADTGTATDADTGTATDADTGTATDTDTGTATDADTETDPPTDDPVTETDTDTREAYLWFEPDVPVAGWDIRFDVDAPGFREDVDSYEWDFGDGTTATEKSVQHAFDSEGTYTVTVTVTTDDGQTFTDTRDVEVEHSDYLPRADICRSGEGYDTDEDIVFQATDSPTGYSADYEWDFGDGTTATGDRVTHSYDTYGTYTVALTATNENGGERTIETQVDVQPGMECTGDGT